MIHGNDARLGAGRSGQALFELGGYFPVSGDRDEMDAGEGAGVADLQDEVTGGFDAGQAVGARPVGQFVGNRDVRDGGAEALRVGFAG